MIRAKATENNEKLQQQSPKIGSMPPQRRPNQACCLSNNNTLNSLIHSFSIASNLMFDAIMRPHQALNNPNQELLGNCLEHQASTAALLHLVQTNAGSFN